MQPGVIETFDPRTMAVTGSVPDLGAQEVAAAVDKARAAFGRWSALPFAERAAHVLRVRDLMLDRVGELVDTLVAETGKLRAEAMATEVMSMCETIGFYASKGAKFLADEKVSSGSLAHKKAYIRYEPLGVVGVISPWNYPLVLAMGPMVTALLAGNTVVLKPSEVTPLVGTFIGSLFADAGDHADIVQVVTGGGATGDALVRSGVQKLVFTGSVRTGKKVMAAAAETLTPVILELGGKDPMLVLEDADLDRAAKGAVWGAFSNSGQTCMAVERVYVHESVYDRFVDKVVTETAAIRQGQGPGHDMGSMTFPAQLEIVDRHVTQAVAEGAKVLTGGKRGPGSGLWYEPTVLVDVDHSMAIMREETFGPVLPIVPVGSDEEALALANDSVFGLNASVWTKDLDRGQRIAARIESGNVCVNDCLVNYGIAGLPFGGAKESGIGRVHGASGLREFTNVKAVLVDRFGAKRELWWYPLPSFLEGSVQRVLKLRYRSGVVNKVKALISG